MSKIGEIVRLRTVMLGNPAGATGVVFNEYKDFEEPDKTGIMVIFPNGRYDGFSHYEQKMFLDEFNMFYKKGKDYVFTSVMQVDMDFRYGYWDFNLIRDSVKHYESKYNKESPKQ